MDRTAEILAPYTQALGADARPYANHCRRCLAVMSAAELSPSDRELAGWVVPFHDLGVWTHRTMDYLEPSIRLAQAYATEQGIAVDPARIRAVIGEHHRITATPDSVAEALRRADLLDLSYGLMGSKRMRMAWRAARGRYPLLGFQRGIYGKVLRYAVRHPLRPVPVVRWR